MKIRRKDAIIPSIEKRKSARLSVTGMPTNNPIIKSRNTRPRIQIRLRNTTSCEDIGSLTTIILACQAEAEIIILLKDHILLAPLDIISAYML
jgi:hypothetical protein